MTRLHEVASRWLSEAEHALTSADSTRFDALFSMEAFWRDIVSFTWDIRWTQGRERIREGMFLASADVCPSAFRLAPEFSAPALVNRVGRDVIEVFFEFDTRVGHGRGLVRLVEDNGAPLGALAWTILTTLQAPRGFAGADRGIRDPDIGYDRRDTSRNWLDRRLDRRDYSTKHPDVLIVGGGHAGLTTAARLGAIGVDSLVIDRHPRVGDDWRLRYKSLALHTKADAMQLPYLAFPTTFPTYIPKDKFANWLETYVESLDISYATSTEFVAGRYDELSGVWRATIRDGAGEVKEMRPQHIVLATGLEGGQPRRADLSGLGEFRGEVLHTSEYQDGSRLAGKRVLVVGAAASGHDVSYDLHQHGAHVTMLQRSPTTVISLEQSHQVFPQHSTPVSPAEADLLSSAFFIYPLMQESLQAATIVSNACDRELLEGLERAGFRVDDGEDHTGYVLKSFRDGGRYYINVGCSDLIIEGAIKVVQTEDIDSLVETGLRLRDGTVLPFDAVILATGFSNMKDQVAALFGSQIAERVGRIGGFDEGYEFRNLYKPTAQPRLWFAGGGIPVGRTYSMSLALLIKAELDGLRRSSD